MKTMDASFETALAGAAVAEPDAVHVWCADLDAMTSGLAFWQAMLSAEERAHAARIVTPRERARFLVGRGVLRVLLGHYLDVDPAAIRFAFNDWGKPSVTLPANRCDLRFNLSHSRGRALYAFSVNREIGIDLERVRPLRSAEEIAARCCAEPELEILATLPGPLRLAAFFHCWTRKEAYLKARGIGLTGTLRRLCVSILPGEAPILLHDADEVDAAAHWSLREVAAGAEFAAAIAAEGHDWRVQSWQFAAGD